jgi:hypothetical protein
MATRNAARISGLRAQLRRERAPREQRSKTLREIIALTIEDDRPQPDRVRRRTPRAVVLR